MKFLVTALVVLGLGSVAHASGPGSYCSGTLQEIQAANGKHV